MSPGNHLLIRVDYPNIAMIPYHVTEPPILLVYTDMLIVYELKTAFNIVEILKHVKLLKDYGHVQEIALNTENKWRVSMRS